MDTVQRSRRHSPAGVVPEHGGACVRDPARAAALLEATARLAHDLNNVLTGIRASVFFLQRDLSPDHVLRGEVEDIDAATVRASRIAGQLLALGRGDAPPDPLALPDRREAVPVTHSAQAGTLTVLVAEDDSRVRRAVTRALQRCGYRVLEAPTGEAALGLAAAFPEPIDLLLTDVVMPGCGGRVLADRLSAERPGLRVLFMSGYTADPLLRERVAAGEPFLAKPFTVTQLTTRVSALIAQPSAPAA